LIECIWEEAVFAKILKDVAVSIWDDHNGKVPDNLNDLLSIPGNKSCSAHLTPQYAFKQLNVSLVTMGLTASIISCNALDLSFFQKTQLFSVISQSLNQLRRPTLVQG